jgi:8-oxo-dGTP pyrophosphatase MutT (NUDIX family)
MRITVGEFEQGHPALELVEPPSLDAREREVIQRWHEAVMRPEAGGYDADRLYLMIPPPGAGIWQVFYAPYSWSQALAELPELRERVGVVAVAGLAVCDGLMLLCQRSHAMRVQPGVWSWTAEGALDVGEHDSPQLAMRRELQEETGIGVDADAIRPMMRSASREDGAAVYWLIYRIELEDLPPLALDDTEVACAQWVADPSAVDPINERVRAWAGIVACASDRG